MRTLLVLSQDHLGALGSAQEGTTMRMLQFADTDATVSSMALGCLSYGTRVDRADAFEQLDHFVAEGGTFLDTANNYAFWEPGATGGESEAIVGAWLRERGARDRVFLATKLGAAPTVDRDAFFAHTGNPWADLTEGLSKGVVKRAVEASLKRLGVDHVDLLYAHVDDRRTPQEETLEAFTELVDAGMVRYVGASNFKVWRLARARELSRANGWAPYRAVQMFHTYFQSEKGDAIPMGDQMGDELFDYARSESGLSLLGSASSPPGLTLLGYTPLLWGSYERPEKHREIETLRHFRRPQNDERMRRLQRVAADTGRSVHQVIYAWMLHGDPPVLPLVAASTMAHLRDDLAAADLVLSAEHLAVLNANLT